MAFSTEFIMGAGGGSGIDLNAYEQTVTLPSGGTTVGEPYVVDKAGVYAVAGFGSLTGSTASVTASVELVANETAVATNAGATGQTSISCFLPMYLAAGDAITMRTVAVGFGNVVIYEPVIAVALVDTVGDGTAHTGGPVQMARDQWHTLASHTVARSGVILVDYGVTFASSSSMQSRIAVNGQGRIVNTVKGVNERWYKMVAVNAGDVVEAQANSTNYTTGNRVVNNWTITFY